MLTVCCYIAPTDKVHDHHVLNDLSYGTGHQFKSFVIIKSKTGDGTSIIV